MKSLMLLWQKVAVEMATWCCTSATMDIKTVQGRFKHEGFSFYTITLPDFGKDLQKALDQGHVDRRLFSGFRKKGELPLFLGGFLDRVFDRYSGELLTDPCIDAIFAIRALAGMMSKVSMPCTPARYRRAMREFVLCEQDIKENDLRLTLADHADFKRVSSLLFGKIFDDMDLKAYMDDMLPKHGPGKTADKLSGNAKFRQTTWPARLDEAFPKEEYLIPSPRFWGELNGIDILEPGSETPVKVVPVPKTLKAPRIIAIEPTAMQYAQQAVLHSFLESFAKTNYLKRMIGFDDQTPNQRMARKGSLTGSLATLDLSEASDRVSNQLVRTMFEDWPNLHRAVDACRSRRADVPGEGVIRLAKFASMGSALCFPVEAMVFCTLVFLGIEKELNSPLTSKTVKQFASEVRIYGDDIIIPSRFVLPVLGVLEHFGARVNAGKSFWTGRFRESCGKDYYNGEDITYVRVRHVFPTDRADVTGTISLVSLRNQLYFAGLWETVSWLDEELTRILKYFPVVLPTSPVLGRHSFLGYSTERTGEYLHNPQVKGYVVTSQPPRDVLDGAGALLKYFLKRGGLPSVDRNHLERSGRPQAVNIKLRWTSSV